MPDFVPENIDEEKHQNQRNHSIWGGGRGQEADILNAVDIFDIFDIFETLETLETLERLEMSERLQSTPLIDSTVKLI